MTEKKKQKQKRSLRIIAVVNQKGGVAKTTTAINLATALVAVGERVLILDLDPQGNASTGLGVERARRTASSYDVLMDAAGIEGAILDTGAPPGLFILPSSPDLSGVELELAQEKRRSFRLQKAIQKFRRDTAENGEARFDYILIDCPPSLNLLTVNAMTAAHAVLVPMQCEFFALEGLTQLMRTVDLVKTSLNPELDIQGLVLTMYDKRNNLTQQVEEDVRAHFGDKVYETVIPRNVRVSEAPSFGKPALLYDHTCLGSKAYMNLAREVIRRERHAA